MKPLRISVRRIGNSLGVVIPKPVLSQVGLGAQAEMTVEHGAIVLRRAEPSVRRGWAEAAEAVSSHGEDELVMGEFTNADDAELTW
jgi:antitoxin MazE